MRSRDSRNTWLDDFGRNRNPVIANQTTAPATKPTGPVAATARPPTAPAAKSDAGAVMASANRRGPTVAIALPVRSPAIRATLAAGQLLQKFDTTAVLDRRVTSVRHVRSSTRRLCLIVGLLLCATSEVRHDGYKHLLNRRRIARVVRHSVCGFGNATQRRQVGVFAVGDRKQANR